MPNWPAAMPDPDWDAVSIGGPSNGVIRTEMSAGPAKQRRRFTAVTRPVALSFAPLTSSVFAAFEAFYHIDLQGGALAFDMAHPITGSVARFRFVASEEPFTVSPVGRDAYRLDVTLELLP